MTEVTILDSQGKNYVSEFMDDLPDNVYLNKVLTGCGATTVAITNDVPYVICVPYISLISSKCYAHQNLCPVYGDVYDEIIEEYLANKDIAVKKFMVTYDSLPRLMRFINPCEYKILIDEAHQLLYSANFRTGAVEKVLDNYIKFKSFVFCTATPVREKYQLPSLKEIPKVKIKWHDVTPVDITRQEYPKEFNIEISSIIIDFFDGTLKGNPYFFINSVKSIATILSILKNSVRNNHTLKGIADNPLNYKIICADNTRNRQVLNYRGLSKYEILDSTSANRKITFITSTGFEGSDFYDKEGVTYICTDGTKDHTKYDILTQVVQIIGRLRNSKYKNKVHILYSPNSYFSYTSVDEYECEIRKQLEKYKQTVDNFSNQDEGTKEVLLENSVVNPYLIIKDGVLKLNENAMYCEMNNYEIINSYYFTKAVSNQLINDVQYNFNNEYTYKDINARDKLKLGQKPNFKQLCVDYHKAKLDKDEATIKLIDDLYSEIKYCYDTLGFDKLQALKFIQKDIIKQLQVNNKSKSQEAKIVELLGYRVGYLLDRQEVKAKLQHIYNMLDIDKKAKATDLKQWYTIKPHAKWVDGKTINKIKIVTCNIKI